MQTTRDASSEEGLFLTSLRFAHSIGSMETLSPRNDSHLKQVLYAALAGDGKLSLKELKGMIDVEAYREAAGQDGKLSKEDMRRYLRDHDAPSRQELVPALRAYADDLMTSLDMIDRDHYQPLEELAGWIAKRYGETREVHVLVACTGNSRRSCLGAALGNLAAAYHGMPKVRFHSGGTAPTAFNRRTIASLQRAGFEIAPTGVERGNSSAPNPEHRVRWGRQLDALEYSKRFDAAGLPHRDFAVILVCGEADAECPAVPGAALRLAMPFIDPKLYDDCPLEHKKYDERRDDIARHVLAVLSMARVGAF
jgi:hypothetical protein